MARALIVGCGCRGRAVAAELLAHGWLVRGTSRAEGGLAEIEAAGVEAVLADPARPGTVLDLVGDVAVVVWLLGSIADRREAERLHGGALERLLERFVDTPVRGFAYEGCRAAPSGDEIVERAARTWRIPVAHLDPAPRATGGADAWRTWAMSSAARVSGAPERGEASSG